MAEQIKVSPYQAFRLLNPIDSTFGGGIVIAKYPARVFNALLRKKLVDATGVLTPAGVEVRQQLLAKDSQ